MLQSIKSIFTFMFFGSLLLVSSASAQPQYPYTSGQAVFVQSPFASSLYTNYTYNQHESAPHRLPSYTTNQAVFIQQPYATAQQTVTSYPSEYRNTLPRTENRYMSPSAFPSTVAPAYPYANVGLYISSPYTTTTQNSTYTYPYRGVDYTTTYTYPYTSSTQTVPYPPTIVEGGGNSVGATPSLSYPLPPNVQVITNANPTGVTQGYASTTYNAYPISTTVQYPYPTTSSGVPEVIVQPTVRPTR